MSVILQIRVNGGAPQTGGVIAVAGDTIQFTAANKSTWSDSTEWRIYSLPAGFSLPAGWSSDANGYFYQGNLDPPSFTVGSWWGKLGTSLRAKVAGQFVTDTETALVVESPNGLRGVFRGEGSQFGGSRERWVGEIMHDLVAIDAELSANSALPLPTRIIVLGQSNAAAIPITPMGLGEISTLCGPDILGWNGFTNAMTQVIEGTANSRANPGGVGLGQGPGLGQIMTRVCRWIADETGETVRTIAQAYTSQGIAYFRDGSATPTFYEDGSQHPSLNTFDYVVASAASASFTPDLVVWVQGEANGGMTEAAYYTQLDGLRTELLAQWPAVRLLIVSTIGNGVTDRIGLGSLQGVRRAQRKLAATYPESVTLVDTADMRLGSYWFSENHYGEESAFGNMCRPYEEVARRVFAALRGDPPLPKVTPLRRVTDVFSFDHIYNYRRAGATTVTQWYDTIGTDHLVPALATTPTFVASAPEFGGRSVIRFDAALDTAGEELGDTSISGTNANQWTVVAVAREVASTLGGGNRCLWLIQDPSFALRIGLYWYASAFSGVPGLFLSGTTIEFTGAPLLNDEVPRVVAVTYDGSAGTAKLYLNGELASTRTGLTNVNIGGTAHLRVGSLLDGAAAAFDGRVGYLAIKSGTVATDAQISELSLALIEEFRLEER